MLSKIKPLQTKENNIEYDEQVFSNYINHSEADTIDRNKIILLRDNMLQKKDRSFLDQNIAP